jgi:hypothetical protein
LLSKRRAFLHYTEWYEWDRDVGSESGYFIGKEKFTWKRRMKKWALWKFVTRNEDASLTKKVSVLRFDRYRDRKYTFTDIRCRDGSQILYSVTGQFSMLRPNMQSEAGQEILCGDQL